MLNVAKELKTFFSSFGLPAYTLESVPDDVTLPYITYPLVEPEWDQQASFYCQIWYRKNNLQALLEKADAVVGEIGTMKKFPLSNGYLVLYPSTPLIQILTDEDSQSAYITLSLNAYHMPGE